jgi:hypothetical protein
VFPILKHLGSHQESPCGCEVAGLPRADGVCAGTDESELVAALGVRETLLRQLVHLPRQLKEHALDCLTGQCVQGLES